MVDGRCACNIQGIHRTPYLPPLACLETKLLVGLKEAELTRLLASEEVPHIDWALIVTVLSELCRGGDGAEAVTIGVSLSAVGAPCLVFLEEKPTGPPKSIWG